MEGRSRWRGGPDAGEVQMQGRSRWRGGPDAGEVQMDDTRLLQNLGGGLYACIHGVRVQLQLHGGDTRLLL